MECTLRFGHFKNLKNKCCGFHHDSPFKEQPHTPGAETRVTKYGTSHSLDGILETPKENLIQNQGPGLSFSLQRKDRRKETTRSVQNDPKKEHVLPTGWCETPKISKKDTSLRRRLLMSRSVTDSRVGCPKTPRGRETICSVNTKYEGFCRMSSGDFDSPETVLSEALATSTLKAEDVALSCRKRRLMFSEAITSTLEDGKSNVGSPSLFQSKVLETPTDKDLDESIVSGLLATNISETPVSSKFMPLVKEDFQTPVSNVATNLSESLSILNTPSFTFDSKLDTSASEDSGFSSLGLDKSHDSSIDHDGSFQELLLPSSSKSREKRRPRLERQCRLSTLREGGSQSEEDLCPVNTVLKKEQLDLKRARSPLSMEDVFLDGTPLGVTRLKMEDLSLTPALQMMHAISRHSARIMPEQTSLEELLKASQDELIKTTMPLSGLIGRKMGIGKLDILAELKMRDLRHIIAMILHHLSPDDIYRFGQVSRIWDEIILQDKKACRRRRSYLKDRKTAFERGSATHVPDAETRLNLVSRSALSSVQAQSKTPSSRTPLGKGTFTPIQDKVSHSSCKREEFLQVAKTLFSHECLKPCPRCQHPARCHPVKREGLCSWGDCGFQFCTTCLCAYHGSKECVYLSVKPRSKRDVLPGSAQSKRNVRRL
ncbi:F-box only protein 43 [Chanos chanos]|uniref:F-box only protein 43 n=1 Tax=Chanos chanos TaxID=29144 RepID=A0A6J2W6F0_CHACN|nr:F-box only protein 43 [Chanos chanos]